MHDVSGKLLNVIKTMYIISLLCVRRKGDESESSRIDSGVRQGSIVSPCLFNVYNGGVTKKVEIGMGRMGVRFLDGGCLASCMQITWFYVTSQNKT